VYFVVTVYFKHSNICLQYSGHSIEMISENNQLKSFDQLFKCYEVLWVFSTSDSVTLTSSFLERGTEIAHVEEDSLHFDTSRLVCDGLCNLGNVDFF